MFGIRSDITKARYTCLALGQVSPKLDTHAWHWQPKSYLPLTDLDVKARACTPHPSSGEGLKAAHDGQHELNSSMQLISTERTIFLGPSILIVVFKVLQLESLPQLILPR